MAFFDEISKTLADKSRVAAQKAKDVAEVLQLKTQITSDKSKVKELYSAIGAVYFKNHREDAEDEYQLFFPEIEKTLAHIAELEEKVRELEGTNVCGQCGSPLKKEDMFCSKCGAAVKKEEPADEDVVDPAEAAAEDTAAVEAGAEVDEDDIFVDESVAVVEEEQ